MKELDRTIFDPTKYNEDVQIKADQYVDGTVCPYVDELSLVLDISDETVNEWSTKIERFSATIRRLKRKQRIYLLRASLDKGVATAGAIFQLKANHGMVETEKRLLDVTSKGDKLDAGIFIVPPKDEGV